MPLGWVLVVRVVVRVPVIGLVDEVSETRAGCLCVPRRRDIRPGLRVVVVVFAERVRAMVGGTDLGVWVKSLIGVAVVFVELFDRGILYVKMLWTGKKQYHLPYIRLISFDKRATGYQLTP